MNAMPSHGRRISPPRRDFFKALAYYAIAGTGALALSGVMRFLDFEADPPRQTEFDLGPAANYAIGSRTVAAQVPALLMHNTDGFAALSLVCTHLGCTVDTAADGFSCPCHGSRYDRQGRVARGPALRKLERLRVETDSNGHVIIHTG